MKDSELLKASKEFLENLEKNVREYGSGSKRELLAKTFNMSIGRAGIVINVIKNADDDLIKGINEDRITINSVYHYLSGNRNNPIGSSNNISTKKTVTKNSELLKSAKDALEKCKNVNKQKYLAEVLNIGTTTASHIIKVINEASDDLIAGILEDRVSIRAVYDFLKGRHINPLEKEKVTRKAASMNDGELLMAVKYAVKNFEGGYGKGDKRIYLANLFNISSAKAERVIKVINEASDDLIAGILEDRVSIMAVYEYLRHSKSNLEKNKTADEGKSKTFDDDSKHAADERGEAVKDFPAGYPPCMIKFSVNTREEDITLYMKKESDIISAMQAPTICIEVEGNVYPVVVFPDKEFFSNIGGSILELIKSLYEGEYSFKEFWEGLE
ncbi:MAG: hypothetical protein LBP51_07600 [Deferribacteraceae bacterium]|jgi:flagellar motility protein MotE (MotC chaperone)|nr:hypothetical protein [Deferribacteraceae bacterium]